MRGLIIIKIFTNPPEAPNEKEIFIDDVDKLVEQVCPFHEGQHPLFKKFGVRISGICDFWERTKNWKELSELEKWKYVALCSLYWEKMYQYWDDKKEYELYITKLKGEKKWLN